MQAAALCPRASGCPPGAALPCLQAGGSVAALGRMLADDARSLSADGISDNDEHVVTVARWVGSGNLS